MIRALWKIVTRAMQRRFVRYLIIGGSSFLLQAGLYALLSRALWRSGDRSVENLIAICITGVFNFFAQRNWTFQAQSGAYAHQMVKYVIGVVTATFLQSFLFWFGHRVLDVYDFYVLVVVGALMACYTYSIHRFFTFRHAPNAKVLLMPTKRDQRL